MLGLLALVLASRARADPTSSTAARRVQADLDLSASRAQLLHAPGREIAHG